MLGNRNVTTIKIGKNNVIVFRDDLKSVKYPGNKFRKLEYFRRLLIEDHQSSQPQYKRIFTCGGNQSNAMLAVAHLANEFNLKFKYFTRPLSVASKNNAKEGLGNLGEAISLGAQIIELSSDHYSNIEAYWSQLLDLEGDESHGETLRIPLGGACPMAEYGIKELAIEINNFHLQYPGRDGVVVVPSGIGTTAFYLHRTLSQLNHEDSKLSVICVPVAGQASCLNQMNALEKLSVHQDLPNRFPIILSTSSRIRFAEPNPQLKAIWCMLKRKGILFDLIYAPVAWKVLFENWSQFKNNVIYFVHTGGISGNSTQLKRYDE